ncbi:hypothetical protein BJ138DRAFT_1182166 [Hygrophoropsis aurantiaca]|uniref:Uncharacterized protein n=1 Tax=Hygrophoropsis aurantiaca TaxID=72124 RepID=A0ACB8A3C4_9AGAM|nr:hypothetical protein BJ138DRAFT_1182166 [Hygrophoropsis aurantiaca]
MHYLQPRQVHLLCIIKVNLIWNRQWNYMTALYFIARYSGMLYIIGTAANVNIFLATDWAGNIFLLTMQAMLAIRVYALFNQSKKVLIFLATSYVLQAAALFVIEGLGTNKRVLGEIYISIGPPIGSVEQLIYVNTNVSPMQFYDTLDEDSAILSITFDTILMFFALWAFVIHTLEAKALNRGWSINVLVGTLVADHLLYFVCNLIWLSLSIAATFRTSELGVSESFLWLDIALSVFNTLVIITGPRMVISLRTTESKTRGEGGTLEGEVSTVQFGIRKPPIQSESAVEEGAGFRAVDENV